MASYKADKLNAKVLHLLNLGVITPSYSCRMSGVVMAKWRGCKLRFCGNFPQLNDVTIMYANPLTRIDEKLSSVGWGRYFIGLSLCETTTIWRNSRLRKTHASHSRQDNVICANLKEHARNTCPVNDIQTPESADAVKLGIILLMQQNSLHRFFWSQDNWHLNDTGHSDRDKKMLTQNAKTLSLARTSALEKTMQGLLFWLWIKRQWARDRHFVFENVVSGHLREFWVFAKRSSTRLQNENWSYGFMAKLDHLTKFSGNLQRMMAPKLQRTWRDGSLFVPNSSIVLYCQSSWD